MATTPKPLWPGVAKKLFIAITGFGLIAFLIVHLIGNLLFFGGPDLINGYSKTLLQLPIIWIIEIGLAGVFAFHFVPAIWNYLRNRSARGPVGYSMKRWAGGKSRKSIASTTMIWTGLVILVFVPLHVAVFKYGWTAPEGHDLYERIATVFQSPGVVVWYVIALGLLGFHLWHGASSAFQTLGWDKQPWTKWIRGIGWVFAVLLALAFISIPITVITGLVGGAQ